MITRASKNARCGGLPQQLRLSLANSCFRTLWTCRVLLQRVAVAAVAVQEDQPLEAVAVDAEADIAHHRDEGLELQRDGAFETLIGIPV